LVVDDDHDTADLMQAVLTDEGYAPSVIYDTDSKSVREAVGRLTPDCVLLDSSKADASQYGESWQIAARLAAGERNIPVIMMTGHVADADEAVAGTSKRARAADFAAVIRKPFDLDEFLTTLSDVLQKGTVRRASDAEIAERLSDLRERLIGAGARGISTSSRRVWAIFRAAGDDDLVQIYWWEKLSLYLVARYSPDGAKLEPLGQFTDVEAAVAIALP
jgi:DNA-binding NtrC family response regulator